MEMTVTEIGAVVVAELRAAGYLGVDDRPVREDDQGA